jgi:hypothetical protein
MTVPGARPCRSPKCTGIIVVLPNRYKDARSRWIAVDVSSLSEDDIARIQTAHSNSAVDYERGRHVSHYKTCLDVERFKRPEKKATERPEKKPEQRTLFNPPRAPWETD